MWLSKDLVQMVQIYSESEKIDEIIIIDNAPNNKFELNSPKLKIYSKGFNICVNPAWNWGVSLAQSENIIIANDDILIPQSDFTNLIELTSSILKEDMIIGPAMTCFERFKNYPKPDKLVIYPVHHGFTYGFGTLMLMKRKSYTVIPDDILIFCGDVIQHDTNKPYRFDGIHINTKMSTTLNHDQTLQEIARRDDLFIKKYNFAELKKII